MNVVYFLKIKPQYKEKAWGGKRILNDNRKIGECWLVSAHENGNCKISNLNDTLLEFFNDNQKLFGTKFSEFSSFPLIIKLIDAKENLSVQIHPSSKKDLINSKEEAWYILDAEVDAKVIYGVKDSLNTNDILSSLNYINVEKDDFIYVQSGIIHAILEGVYLLEIQESNDVTYRLYDWGRNRETHANLVLRYMDDNQNVIPEVKKIRDFNLQQNVYKGTKFKIDKLIIHDSYFDRTSDESCHILIIVECNNNSRIIINNEEHELLKNDSYIVLKNTDYKLVGSMKCFKIYL